MLGYKANERKQQIKLAFGKVRILWEGDKIWKYIPPVLTKQLFLLSSLKTSGLFVQIFVYFSEKLEFMKHSYLEDSMNI